MSAPNDSWSRLKKKVMSHCRNSPGTVGYLNMLDLACDAFIAVIGNLTDRGNAEAAFNQDLEVSEALLSRHGRQELYSAIATDKAQEGSAA